MKYLIVSLVFLAGCASSQHKHPHDHGLSAVHGTINQLERSNKTLRKRFEGLLFQLDEIRKKQAELVEATDLLLLTAQGLTEASDELAIKVKANKGLIGWTIKERARFLREATTILNAQGNQATTHIHLKKQTLKEQLDEAHAKDVRDGTCARFCGRCAGAKLQDHK